MAFAWVKVEINTYNRDRKGGHETLSHDPDDQWDVRGSCHSKNGRAFGKKADRKKQRRDHKRVTRNEVLEYHQTHVEALREAEDLWMQEIEEFWQEDDYDDYQSQLAVDPYYYDDYPSDPLDDVWYYDDYRDCRDYAEDTSYSAGSLTREGLTRMDMNARIIKEEDAGQSLGDILQEFMDRRKA